MAACCHLSRIKFGAKSWCAEEMGRGDQMSIDRRSDRGGDSGGPPIFPSGLFFLEELHNRSWQVDAPKHDHESVPTDRLEHGRLCESSDGTVSDTKDIGKV